MSPAPQCTKKICEALPFCSLLFHNQSASTQVRGYIPNPDGSVVQWHAKKSECSRVILQTQLGKTIPMSTRNFPPRHQVSSWAQNMPRVPEQRTCQLNRKFADMKAVERGSKDTRGQLSDAKCHKIHQCVLPW